MPSLKTSQKLSSLKTSRAWAEISTSALIHNAGVFSPLSKKGIMAVVKANAYGHGAVGVSRALAYSGVCHFCVASLQEGIELRAAGIPGEILILGYTPPQLAGQIGEYDLTQAVIDENHAGELAAYSPASPIKIHIAVDTGMHRLGLAWDRPELIRKQFFEERFCVTGVFSHLCAADSQIPDDQNFTLKQFERFNSVIKYLHRHGLHHFSTHIQSSYGLLNYSQFHYDYSRIGIALYGVYSSPANPDGTANLDGAADPHGAATAGVGSFCLIPAMTIKARIARILSLNEGESLGYGRAYTAKAPMKAAVISIGYADGIPRNIDETFPVHVLIQGQKAPIIGRVCMDQLFADVTQIPNVWSGMEAVIMGRDEVSGKNLDAAQMARACGTISNEILSRLGQRLERIYV